jgi:Raf kinase inhibitor-like YbhB/YbcL family protein
MRVLSTFLLCAAVSLAQNPPAGRGGGRGGGGLGRTTAIQNFSVLTTAWPDGGMIPLRYTQAGPEISPAIQWSTPPPGTASYVLIFYDADTPAQNSTDGTLQWMLWNIPGSAMQVTQGRPDGFQWEDGTRQISASGSRYRGPGAPASGPVHHYILELFAVDKMVDVKVNPQGPQEPNPNPQAIRAAVLQEITGHVRARAAYVGLFHRPQ